MPRKWSQEVTESSDAMDLEDKVFTKPPKQMARSVLRSAQRSKRRKSSPYQSAMSMLTFYENRAGRNLSAADRKRVDAAKDELRRIAGPGARRGQRPASAGARGRTRRSAKGRSHGRRGRAGKPSASRGKVASTRKRGSSSARTGRKTT